MSDSNDLIEQAKGMNDSAKIVKVSKVCGLDISEAEAKAFVETKELPDSAMDAIAGGSVNKPQQCPECGEEFDSMCGGSMVCSKCGFIE